MEQTQFPIDEKILLSLQANILKGHGRNFAQHLFFKIDPDKRDLAKAWIAEFAKNRITSANDQIEKTRLYKDGTITDGGTVRTLSISKFGYDHLSIKKPSQSQAFLAGMEKSAEKLRDNRSLFQKEFQSELDVIIVIADDHPRTVDAEADIIINETKLFFTLLVNQKGNVLKKVGDLGIEHFGYADGISQPLFLQKDISGQPSTIEWNDATDPKLVLVRDENVPDENSFGSFFVFRKLEQNVFGFDKEENDKLPEVLDAVGVPNEDLAGAMNVGRFENSVPVTKKSIDQMDNPPMPTNDFDYRGDTDGLKCPYHAHIRLMNPRNGKPDLGDISQQRITRRGIPYDEVGRIPEDQVTKITDEMLEKNRPEKGVGLLFMCYQSNIENQFEILQSFWTVGQFAQGSVKGEDSIINQGEAIAKQFPKQWGQPGLSDPIKFEHFVTTLGGEYFFTPSLPFLKNLAPITS